MPGTPAAARSPAVGLSREELEAALVEHSGVIWHYVHHFHRLNPRMELDDLYQEAAAAFVKSSQTYDRRRVNPVTGKPYTVSGYGGYAVYCQLQTYFETYNRRGMNGRANGGTGPNATPMPGVVSFEAIRATWRSREPHELGREDDRTDLTGFWLAVEKSLADQPRALRVVRLHYRDGMYLNRVAGLLGVSKVRAGQMRDQALRLLRERLSVRWLEELSDG